MKRLTLVMLAIGLLVAGAACAQDAFSSGGQSARTDGALNGPLHVDGNRLRDASSATVILRGAQIPGYNVAATYASFQGLTPAAFSAMRSWHMNELRLPFSGCLITNTPGYLAGLETHVHDAEAAGLYVVLAMFEDSRAGCHLNGVRVPPPQAESAWHAVASAFASDRNVLFDLFNEPLIPRSVPTETAWETWLNGGSLPNANGGQQTVVGMNQLAAAIRGAGAASQPLIAEPWNGVPVSEVFGHQLADHNVMYSVHTYFAGDTTEALWASLFGNATSSLAVFVGEWAFLPNASEPRQCADLNLTTQQATTMVNQFMQYMDAHGVSYNAWAFIPSRLIVDDSHFQPTTIPDPLICDPNLTRAGMGSLYRQHLLAISV